jgi:hypothetical protein
MMKDTLFSFTITPQLNISSFFLPGKPNAIAMGCFERQRENEQGETSKDWK